MKRSLVIPLILAACSWVTADDKAKNSPTHANVAYGPHKPNVLDIWIAEGDGPRPLHVYIHGGGWTAGDKFRKGDPQRQWLAKESHTRRSTIATRLGIRCRLPYMMRRGRFSSCDQKQRNGTSTRTGFACREEVPEPAHQCGYCVTTTWRIRKRKIQC